MGWGYSTHHFISTLYTSLPPMAASEGAGKELDQIRRLETCANSLASF